MTGLHFRTSTRVLILLAAAVWIIGGLMLFRSGIQLVQQAFALRPGEYGWPGLFILLGIGLGILQARTLFRRSCERNLQRIHQLPDPRVWQFFRPGFFLALAVMITSGVLLDVFSQGRYFFMLGVAGLDFALTISLLGSSPTFITWKSDS